jgi:hypothetical protein
LSEGCEFILHHKRDDPGEVPARAGYSATLCVRDRTLTADRLSSNRHTSVTALAKIDAREPEPLSSRLVLFDIAIKEEFMRMKLFVAAAGFAALATPSLAAEFYIVQDSTTKRCTIVEQKPTSQTTTVVEGGRTYTTRQEAEGAMKTVKVCETGGTVGGPVPPPLPR